MTCKNCIHYDVCNDVIKSINRLPFDDTMPANKFCSAFKNKSDYAKVKHGEWEKVFQNEKATVYQCSNCHHLDFGTSEYCICGAKMVDGVER